MDMPNNKGWPFSASQSSQELNCSTLKCIKEKSANGMAVAGCCNNTLPIFHAAAQIKIAVSGLLINVAATAVGICALHKNARKPANRICIGRGITLKPAPSATPRRVRRHKRGCEARREKIVSADAVADFRASASSV